MRWIILTLFLSAPLLADPLPPTRDRLVLQDGSVLAGELLNFDGNTYHFKSDSLGELSLEAERVARLYTRHNDDPGEASGFLPPPAVNLGDGDPTPQGPLDMLLSLQRDPQVRVFIEDILALSALANGDVEGVMQNPKMLELFDDPLTRMVVKRILEETRQDRLADQNTTPPAN